MAQLNLSNATLTPNDRWGKGGVAELTGEDPVKVEGNYSNTITFKNGDKVSYKNEVLSFSSAKGGEYDFINDSGLVVTYFDKKPAATLSAVTMGGASKVTLGDVVTSFTGSSEDDIVILSSGAKDQTVNMGAGKDSIAGAGAGQVITLGAGKDYVDIGKGKVTIADYNYKEDVIVGLTSLSADGVGITGNDASITIGEGKDVYYAQDYSGNYFATAADGVNAKIELALSTDHSVAFVDASAANMAEVNLTGAGVASVNLSKTNKTVDVLTLGTGSKDSPTVTVYGFETAADEHDKLVLSGAKLDKDLDIAGDGTNTTIKYKKDIVVLSGVKDNGVIDLNGTTLAFDVNAAGTLKDTDAQAFYGLAKGNTTLEVSKSTYLNVNEANYKNINRVSLSEEADEFAGIQIGGSKADDVIDVSKSKVGVEVYGDKGNDTIELSAGADTLWVGGNNKDTDTVTGFQYGSVAEADTLYLFDTAKLADIKLAVDTSATVTAGKSSAELQGVKAATDVNSEIVKVKLQDGNTYNVLAGLNGTTDVKLDAADQASVNFFILDKAGSTIKLNGEEGTSSFLNSGYTSVYTGKLGAVDGSGMKGDMTVGNVKAVTLGTGTNEYWAFGTGTAELQVKEGTDTIWFQAGVDKKVEVTGFDAENDSIKLLGTTDVNSVVDAYKFTVDGGNTVITGIGTSSKMTLDAVVDEAVTIKTDTEEFKALMANRGAATFADDVKIYAGMETVEVTNDVAGPLVVGMGTASSKLMGGAFIGDSVTTFDANATDAVTVIRGSETKGSTIIGGKTKNDMYGGGSTKDTLIGNDDAIDTFWFGANDGVDTVQQVDAKDSVYLWNVSSADIASVMVTADDAAAKLVIGNNSILHIQDNGLTNVGELTFTTSDGANFVYSAEQKKLVAKQ